jgi:hypothetical protein
MLRAALVWTFISCCAAQDPGSIERSRQSWYGGTNRSRVTGKQAGLPMQPLAQQVRRLESALVLLGQPLDQTAQDSIDKAISLSDEGAGVALLQRALDPSVLAIVDINAESRVKVERGAAPAELVQGGSRFFLVKVVNQAGVTAPVVVTSPNSGNVYITSDGDAAPPMVLTQADVRERWAEISIASSPPLEKRLSGFPLEYQIMEIYSRDAGQRSADIAFSVGQGTQDLGYRNEFNVLFDIQPSHKIKLHILDENGQPALASLTIRDGRQRLYPNPSKRLAPDLYFQPQIYRADGESIELPPGNYTMTAKSGFSRKFRALVG